jgi:hypothetical protein
VPALFFWGLWFFRPSDSDNHSLDAAWVLLGLLGFLFTGISLSLAIKENNVIWWVITILNFSVSAFMVLVFVYCC